MIKPGTPLVPVRKVSSGRVIHRFHSSFRVDPHPTWDRSGRYVIFNGYGDNTRCVYIADLGSIIKKVSKKSERH